MGERVEDKTALGDLRVLDLADEKGTYCTKTLADLGADVIRIEPPGGDATRDIPPFYQDIPHRERSLYFWQYNSNKRGITLALETAEGRDIFKRLVRTADILVETFRPGYLDNLGLGYSVLSELNPGLIMTSITAFGQTGPYKDYQASDIVGVAMGGMMNACGHPDGPPVMPYGRQGYHTAANHAAIATLIALFYRDMEGRGQHIDVSMQTAIAQSLEFSNEFYFNCQWVLKRQGSRHGSDGIGEPLGHVLPCKGGYVCNFGHIGPLDWMEADGAVGTLKDDPRWLQDPIFRRVPENMRYLDEQQRAWTMLHTGKEITEGCQNMHISWAKCSTLEELFEDEHLLARGFWIDVEHPELGATFKYPGVPYILQKTPWRFLRRAPLIGEHNTEIYQNELGFTGEELSSLKAAGVI